MSKSKKILIIFLIIILIAIVALGVFYFYKKSKKNEKVDYKVESVDQYNYFVLKNGEKCGVIDNQGNTVINADYDNIKIPNPSKDIFICYVGDDTKVLNSNKEEILTQYKQVEPIKLKNVVSDLVYEKSVLTYKENNQMGLISFEGKILLEANYDEIDSLTYKEGELLIKKDGKIGVANINGYIIIEPQYNNISVDNVTSETEEKIGYIVEIKTEDGLKYGYVDSEGNVKLDSEYNEITKIENKDQNYIIACKNGKYGFLKNYEKIIDFDYQDIEYDNENEVLIIQKGTKYGLANLNGKFIIPVENNELEIKGLYVYTKKDEQNIVYDMNGEKQNIDYNTTISKTKNENYKIKVQNIENKTIYGVIDNKGNEIVPNKYLYLEYVYDQYFIACGENGKLGIIDVNDNIIVDLKYDLVQKINDKNAVQTLDVSTKDTSIYSSKMEKTLEMKNANIITTDNYIKIYSNTDLKYLDNDGNVIQSKDVLKNKLFAYKENEKWGFEDSNSQVVVEPKYERVTDFNDYGFAGIKQNGKWGVINSNGEIVLEPTYKIDYQEPEFINKYYKSQYGFGEIYYTDLTK